MKAQALASVVQVTRVALVNEVSRPDDILLPCLKLIISFGKSHVPASTLYLAAGMDDVFLCARQLRNSTAGTETRGGFTKVLLIHIF